ncbi:MAG: DUF4105 domain-containing protein [Pseudomonadota bacterium]
MHLFRMCAWFGLGLCVVALGLWGALVIWFTLPLATWLLAVLGGGYVIVGLLCLYGGYRAGRPIRGLLPFALLTGVVAVWWSQIQARNDRDWLADVAQLPSVEVEGSQILLRNVRNFDYSSETDFVPRWEDWSLELDQLQSLDLIAVYWMGDTIAHTILSFGFGERQVAISIEIRKEKGEGFSTIAGFFRRYELYYVVGDERDLIGVRANHRDPREDVYLYRVQAPKVKIRELFLEYAKKINRLREVPEFYNTLTTNCTTNIATHAWALGGDLPVSWKILASGYFPELVYQHGALDQSLPFEELKRRSLVNDRAQTAEREGDFSKHIRAGLPGM